MAHWSQLIPHPNRVPEWSADGDGMIAIQHCTPENNQCQSRFDDDAIRPCGYCGFNECAFVGVWSTLDKAKRAMELIATALGYDQYTAR